MFRSCLTPLDLKYLEFAHQFETPLIAQSGRRTLEESMAGGWQVLRRLPAQELTRLSDAQIAHYIAAAAMPEKSRAHA